MADISTFLHNVKLPVMPEVAHALIRTLNDEDADMQTVRDVIAKDPSLTATLLRMANSAIFGLSRSVETLDSAVSVVGMSQIRARALSICMAQVFKFPAEVNRLEFWRNCMVSAGYARWIAGQVGLDEQAAWLTAMMLRLGQLTIAEQNSSATQSIERMPRLPGERWQREREHCGFDEGEITAEIARRWDFPDLVVDGLQYAANPLSASKTSKMAAVVHIAAWLADLPPQTKQPLSKCPQGVIQSLSLNLEKIGDSVPDAESFADISMLHS